MIKFHEAKDSKGALIDIKEVTKENRVSQYYCIGCGEEVYPVLGNKREHHFRHKKNLLAIRRHICICLARSC